MLYAIVNLTGLTTLPDTIMSLVAAFILGGLIGYERQCMQRTAGLKTNVLVALGAAVFVNMGNHIWGQEGAIRVGAYVVSGIGFLGAGIIMREAGSVIGLNTAATLWCSAAVGTCTGCGLIIEATLATFAVLGANIMLKPLAMMINRHPIALSDLEGVCAVYVIAHRKNGRQAMSLLRKELHKLKYYIRRLEIHPFGNDELQIEAVIDTSLVNTEGLDTLVENMYASQITSQSYWSRGAMV